MQHDLDWLVNDYGNFLAKFGLDEASVRQHYTVWRERSGRDSAHDYLWYLFEVILGETARQVTDPTDLQKNNLEIYGAMWFFRTHVEGEPANDLQQLMNEAKVRLWQTSNPAGFGLKLVGTDCCAYCNDRQGVVFPVEEALNGRAFSAINCTSPSGCSCFLLPVPKPEKSANGEASIQPN